MDLKLNQRAYELLNKTAEENELRRVEYSNGTKKATVIDAGVNAKFGQKKAFEFGAKIADASMGCLGKTVIKNNVLEVIIPEKPAVAALSCQLAGWEITVGDHGNLHSQEL